MRETYQGIPINSSRNTHQAVARMIAQEAGIRKILDIPCGQGAFTQRLLDLGMEVHSADCVNMMRVPQAMFRVCDMNAPLPYADKEFDAVVCIDGIAHTENPFAFVRECRRILHRDGSLIISTPNISSLRSRWRWLWTGFHNKRKTPLNEAYPSPEHIINILSFQQIRYLLHTNGFQIHAVQANRIKPVSWMYSILAPAAYLMTFWVFHREEKDAAQRVRNQTILKQMFTPAVLFGETLIVKAGRPL